MLTGFTGNKTDIKDLFFPNLVCRFTACEADPDLKDYMMLLVYSWLACSVCYVFFEQANIWIHHNACDRRNEELKRDCYKHLLSLNQKYYDLHNTSDIRSRMRFDCINNQITWNVP